MATLFPTTVAPRGFVSTDPELAAVDASVRWPVLRLLPLRRALDGRGHVPARLRLVADPSAGHLPILGFFVTLSNNFSMFTYGRVWPAAIDALVYGWASTAGLGLAVWLLARMSREPVCSPGALMTAVIFWNLGVAIGLTGIFIGDSTGIELLEFPILRLLGALVRLRRSSPVGRGYLPGARPGHDHIAQAWVLVALFAFPWLYARQHPARRPFAASNT